MHRMIRDAAKDFAGAFYEQNLRSEMFRRAYPTASDYIHGKGHRRDGSLQLFEPHWLQFVDMAKEYYARLLTDPTCPQYMKDRIEDMLIDNAMRGAFDPNAQRIIQSNLEKREDAPLPETMVRI